MSYKNVVYEWNSICDHLGGKVAKEPMTEFAEDLIAHETGFAGEYEEGDDWSDDELVVEYDETTKQAQYDHLGEDPEDDIGWWGEAEDELRELTDIPYYLYKQCREEEGMSKEEAIEETRNRFWEK